MEFPTKHSCQTISNFVVFKSSNKNEIEKKEFIQKIR